MSAARDHRDVVRNIAIAAACCATACSFIGSRVPNGRALAAGGNCAGSLAPAIIDTVFAVGLAMATAVLGVKAFTTRMIVPSS